MNSRRVSFLYGETTVLRLQPAESRGSKDIPRCQGCRLVQRFRMGGAKFVLKSFVHAARKPETGSFIRTGHMTGGNVLFKAPDPLIPRNDE